jgi:hypothetical protein
MNTKIKFAVKQFFSIRPQRDLTLSNRYVSIAAIAVVLSQLADFGSTWLGFQFGAREGNGVMADIIHQYGFGGFLAVKLLGAALLVYLTWRRKVAPWVLVGVYSAIVMWNLSLAYTLNMLGGLC